MALKTWEQFFKPENQKEYAKILHSFLDREFSTKVVFPPRNEMFRAFTLTPLEKVSVVIIGQDPYHEPGQAMGLSFSVAKGIKLPPSLVNIYKEIENDLKVKMDFSNGDLTHWASQGVLLLNSLLTVRQGEALSHNKIGYEEFLHSVLRQLDAMNQPIVFMLWGSFARSLKTEITNPLRLVLESSHPSPLSANRGGWFGTRPFSKANLYLKNEKVSPIRWENSTK